VSDPRALDDVFAAIAAAMRESASRWYVFGAQAATLWGRPRLTADVDVTAEIPAGRRDDFLEAMKRHTFRLRVDDREFIDRTRVFPFLHEATGDRKFTRRGLNDVSDLRSPESGRSIFRVPRDCLYRLAPLTTS
jgi:hypothetical protein